MSGPLVEIAQLSMAYSEGGSQREILKDVTVAFARGSFNLLLGPSGCGKSTLLNLIGGLDRPHAGSIRIDGVDITGLDERARTLFRRRQLGIIFQFFNLLPSLTVLENVLLPLQLNRRRHQQPLALEWLGRVGLGARAQSYPDRLSGGEQQRVAIVRAMLHEPKLILADEPTGNLDETTAEEIVDLLQQLVREKGGTLIMVTHNPDFSQRADAVFHMHEGRLARQ